MNTDTFIPNGNMTVLQQEYLYDNVLDAIDTNNQNNVKQIITFSADTGQGKTWMILNHLIPAMIKRGYNNILYIAPDTGVVGQTTLEAQQTLMLRIINGKPVNVIDHEQGKKYINGKLPVLKNVINIFFISKQMFLTHKNTFAKGILSPAKAGKWLVFDDEAHQHTGTWDLEDVRANTGSSNKKAKLSTARALRAFLNAGADIVQLSATLTNSQKQNTPKGKKLFKKLPTMPREPLLSTFADFTSISALGAAGYWQFDSMLKKGLQMFAEHSNMVADLHNSITDKTWNILRSSQSSKFAEVMPDLIIKAGQDGATNGLPYEDCIDYITKFANKHNFILADLVENTYNGMPVKNTSDMIFLVNNNPMKSHIVVVKEKLNVGANISTLTHAIVVRNPSSKIHNNYSQFLGRMTRMPFFRSHAEAKSFIHNIDIHFDQKALLINYYALMNWAHAIVPLESELLGSRVNVDDDADFENETVMDFRLRSTWSLEQGKKYLFEGLQESCSGSNKFGYSISRLTQEQANFIKEKFCETCPRDEFGLPKCLPNVYEAHSKLYGFVDLEEFLSHSNGSTLVREHRNGNHYDNDPSNVHYVCANLSGFKTDICKDWNQRYDIVNGKKVPRKINQFDV